MLQKIQTLQRRLIQKTEEVLYILTKDLLLSSVFQQVVEKELLIQEKEKLYMELKHILARQPGPEVAEQLQIYQQTLKEKTKQMKVELTIHINYVIVTTGAYISGKARYNYNITLPAPSMTKVKREKSFAVYWIPSKCRKSFHGFCFICNESAASVQSIHGENFRKIHKIAKLFSRIALSFMVLIKGIVQFQPQI